MTGHLNVIVDTFQQVLCFVLKDDLHRTRKSKLFDFTQLPLAWIQNDWH